MEAKTSRRAGCFILNKKASALCVILNLCVVEGGWSLAASAVFQSSKGGSRATVGHD